MTAYDNARAVDHLGETLEWEDRHRVRAAGSGNSHHQPITMPYAHSLMMRCVWSTSDVDSILGDSEQLLGRLKSKYDDKARLYQ